MNEQEQFYGGFIKATRSQDALELIRRKPFTFILAYVIAHRARWREGFDADGRSIGEALLGDHDQYGMTRQEYRTAIKNLAKYKFATFKPTPQGTIARLLDTRLFNPCNLLFNQQVNHLPTTVQPAPNQPVTTNEELKNGKNGKNHESLRTVVLKNRELPELMEQCKEVLGVAEMKVAHSRWHDRARFAPEKLRRVIADTAAKVKEDGLDNPAAWAETMWKEFS